MLVWVFLSMTGSHSYFKALTLIFLCSWCLPALAMLGSNIEGFMQSLKREEIVSETDGFRPRNSSDDPSYNGAIRVSRDQKACLLP